MAKTISIKVDAAEKKIIDLIRKHNLDYIDVKMLLVNGTKERVKNTFDILEYGKESERKNATFDEIMQRDLDKYTKLLQHLEKGE